MTQIVPCKEHFEELVHFVTRLNSDGTHHIGFFGEGEADVRASLAECLIPPADGFLLTYENDQLVGAFGVDADSEINRAWLFGPLVEHNDWHTIADKLYEQVLSIIPAGIGMTCFVTSKISICRNLLSGMASLCVPRMP